MDLRATLLTSFPAKISSNTETVRRDHKEVINIRSIVVLKTDLIIISDFVHGLKSFDSKGKPLDKLKISSTCSSMTKMSASRIAYLIAWDCEPLTVLVDVDLDTGKLKQFKRIVTNFNYRAIAAIDSQTWASGATWWNGAGAIDVFNMDGEILKSYNKNQGTKTLLECPIDMVISKNGKFIVADGNAETVISVDPKAADDLILFEFKDEGKLSLPFGIACDDSGRIYVTDNKLNHVIVLSADGVYLQTILNSEDIELNKPSGVAVFEDRLYVVEREGSVKIFQLHAQPTNSE